MLRPPVWVADLARRFWEAVPAPPPAFPRDLADSLAWLPHARLVPVPRLTLARAAAFLARAGVPFPAGSADRPLRGCVAAHGGTAHVLFDPEDDPSEVRFTVAHEWAHVLRDYEAPRRRAAARLGPAVLEVFDGLRDPTPDERLAGVLRGVIVGCHTHLLGRDERGRPETPAARGAEDAADRLAFELLAPFDAVAAGPVRGRASLASRLAGEFGLPAGVADGYASHLLPVLF
jgi:hypothetical protein